MITKVWYLPYFEGVYHTWMIETFSNANAHIVHMVHTMLLVFNKKMNVYENTNQKGERASFFR